MSLSRVQLFVTPRTVACPASLSMGILQARILEWVAMPSSRGSSQPRDRTQVSCIAGRILYHLSHQGSSEGRAKWKVIDRTIWGAFTGQQPSKVKTMKPPAKVKIPQAEVQDEEPEEEEQRAGGEEAGGRLGLRGSAQGLTSFLSSWAGPSVPPPQVVKKPPLSQGAARAAQEAEAEPATEVGPGGGHRPAGGKAVVRSSDPEPWRAEPSPAGLAQRDDTAPGTFSASLGGPCPRLCTGPPRQPGAPPHSLLAPLFPMRCLWNLWSMLIST